MDEVAARLRAELPSAAGRRGRSEVPIPAGPTIGLRPRGRRR